MGIKLNKLHVLIAIDVLIALIISLILFLIGPELGV